MSAETDAEDTADRPSPMLYDGGIRLGPPSDHVQIQAPEPASDGREWYPEWWVQTLIAALARTIRRGKRDAERRLERMASHVRKVPH